ncbi:MAG: alanine racemase [Syntrophobacteraceae bacterium]
MMPAGRVEIDLAALRHNYFQARARLPQDTCIVGIVKSDAYGHGMIPVAHELCACGVNFLAVGKFCEAMEIREAGIRVPIIALLGLDPAEMEEALKLDIRPVLFRLDHAKLLSRAACRLNLTAHVHLKIDTGMGRLGVPSDELPNFLDQLLALPGIQIEGVLSHFAEADDADTSYSDYQIERFKDAMQTIASRGSSGFYSHIANSAGILHLPGSHFQLVRPGIMLYGSAPSRGLQHSVNLRPVMSLKAGILQLKPTPAGHSIGYGRTFVTHSESLMATIPIGYDDGYPRLLSNKGQVLVRGKRAPIVGRISMNLLTADVSHIADVKEDDEVVLLGAQGDERITAEEIADLCGSISYEIYCNIGRQRFKYFLNPSVPLH